MGRWSSRGGKSQRREEKKILKKRKCQKKEGQSAWKGRKSQNTALFEWFAAPDRRKVGSLKRRARSHLDRWEMKIASGCGVKHMSKSKWQNAPFSRRFWKCTQLWPEADFEVKMYKTPQRRSAFGSSDVQKAHAVVARSTFQSQNAKNTTVSDHFW